MKKYFQFSIIYLSLFSCKIDQIQDSQLDAFGPWNKDYKSTSEVFSKDSNKIIEKYYELYGWNYYYLDNSNTESYLFSSSIDATKKIKTVIFEPNGRSFAILAKGSKGLNWKSGNRLVVYKLVNNKPIEILDTAQEEYIDIYFEKDDFVYVPKTGVAKCLKIN